MHVLVLTSDDDQFQRICRIVEQEGGLATRSTDVESVRHGEPVDVVVFDWTDIHRALPELARRNDCFSLALLQNPADEVRDVVDAGADDWLAADASDTELQGRLLSLMQRLRQSARATHSGARTGSRPWRTWLSAMLLVVGGLLAGVAHVALWQQRILEDEDTFVATTLPLIRDATVQARLARSIADQINEAIDLRALLQEYLPPNMKALTMPISMAARELVFTASRRAIEAAAFSDESERVLAKLHARLIEISENEARAVIIDDNRLIVDFYQVAVRILEDFGFGSGEAILNELDIPPNIGLFVVTTREEYTLAWWLIENFRPLTTAVSLLALLALLGSVAFASNRPRAVIAVGGALACAVVVTLIGLQVVESKVMEPLSDPGERAIVQKTLDVLSEPFQTQSTLAILAGLALMFLGSFLSTARSVVTADDRERAGMQAWMRQRVTGLRVIGLGVAAVLLLVWPEATPRGVVAILALVGLYLSLLTVLTSDADWAAGLRRRSRDLWPRRVAPAAAPVTETSTPRMVLEWIGTRCVVFRWLGVLLAGLSLLLWPELSIDVAARVLAVLLLYLAGIEILLAYLDTSPKTVED